VPLALMLRGEVHRTTACCVFLTPTLTEGAPPSTIGRNERMRDSRPGIGCTVRAEIPLAAAKAAVHG